VLRRLDLTHTKEPHRDGDQRQNAYGPLARAFKLAIRLNATGRFATRGTRTLIADLTHDQRIAPWVIKGATNSTAIGAYIRAVLRPEIAIGVVGICDNLVTHKNALAGAAKKPMCAGCCCIVRGKRPIGPFLMAPPATAQTSPLSNKHSQS